MRIASPDVKVKPELRLNYLSTPEDCQEWIEAIGAARTILSQPAFAAFDGGEISPSPEVQTKEQLLEFVRRDGETAYHPSCTCRMGNDEMSVIDPLTMRVRGMSGIRVVDASVMPYVTNGNIYAPTMMIAEKAADIILENLPLPPQTVKFFSYSN